MLTWQQYQMAVGALYEELEGVGKVRHNIMLKDRNTGQLRQVDIWVSMKLKEHEINLLIDAKYRKDAINVKQVEEVLSLAQAVGADKAVIVAPNGWTQPAERKAKSHRMDLRLFSLEEATKTLDWHSWHFFPEIRSRELAKLFGKSADYVIHSIIHFTRGGSPDIMLFHGYHNGITYITTDLTGPLYTGQIPCKIGQYEVMICTQEEAEWAPNIISDIARYSIRSRIDPGDTATLGYEQTGWPEAILFTTPEPEVSQFSVLGKKYGLLLCIGISSSELSFAQNTSSAKLLRKLKSGGVFPFTNPRRRPVC